MNEHQFDSDSDPDFDYSAVLDELRCHPSEWLHEARDEAVREQRWWHLRELAITSVLEERGHVDDTLAGKDGTTTRNARRKRQTARNLRRQPKIAEAAARGKLSQDQLDHVSDLAGDDSEADEHWAKEGPTWSPTDLADRVRAQRKPTVEDAAARRAARELRFWWRKDTGMLDGRLSLPDIDGALVESVLNQMIERMRPAKGERWDTREHRGADALVELCRNQAGTRTSTSAGTAAHLIVQVPMRGPATVAGVPLPDEMVERLRADARIEPVLVDDEGHTVHVGTTVSALSDKTRRVVRQRDGKCRWPGCEHRIGLEVHHLWPRSWGGSDDLWNLASVCASHHARLAPQGRLLLLGNPNNPAGLTLVDRDDLPTLADLAATRARAGPDAA